MRGLYSLTIVEKVDLPFLGLETRNSAAQLLLLEPHKNVFRVSPDDSLRKVIEKI